jgi:hypothetical protein
VILEGASASAVALVSRLVQYEGTRRMKADEVWRLPEGLPRFPTGSALTETTGPKARLSEVRMMKVITQPVFQDEALS